MPTGDRVVHASGLNMVSEGSQCFYGLWIIGMLHCEGDACPSKIGHEDAWPKCPRKIYHEEV
jgi:hypothetical protein